MKNTALFFVSAALSLTSVAQPHIYTTDPSIKSTVDEKVATFDGRANANIVYTVYEGEKVVMRSKETGDGALAFTSFNKDVLGIDCLNGVNNGFGFFLALGKDTSFVKFKVLSNSDKLRFKSLFADPLVPELLVNCASKSVTLTSRPSFASGEIVSGRVQLESDTFYEVANGKERRIRFTIDCFFNSEPTPVVNKQYKTLRKL